MSQTRLICERCQTVQIHCTCNTSDSMETYPAVIFDAYAVYQAMSEKAQIRTSPDNVADVLEAVADLIRQDLKER